MSSNSLTQSVSEAFEAQFGAAPAHVVTAPGRVNLLGEHTDYNGGYVLPMPLTLQVCIAIGPGDKPGFATLYSQSFEETCEIALAGTKSDHWSDFILGSFKLSEQKPDLKKGYRLAIGSSLPMGAGISSSAALEVVSLRAIAAYMGVVVDPVAIAHTARRVENAFVGMPCGIMDQFVSSVGVEAMALFLDARSMDYELAPLIPGYKIITMHSGVAHKLTDGSYEQRVKECASACAMLGIDQLRDVGMDDLDRIEALGGVETRRARHIVTENQRVLDGVAALKARDAATFGRLMVESHASQRDDYAITVPETDALVESALAAGAMGARQTGGGFGGAIVALLADDQVDTWCNTMTRDHPQTRILDIT